jgi:hypothetical protein
MRRTHARKRPCQRNLAGVPGDTTPLVAVGLTAVVRLRPPVSVSRAGATTYFRMLATDEPIPA